MIRWLLPRLAWTALYAGVLLWFHGIDVYHKHFATTGLLVVAHNFFRVLFIVYLFWIVHAVGTLMLRLAGAKVVEGLSVPEGLALGFFAGTGVWHVLMLALGYLNLYTVPVATALTLPLVFLSYGNLAAATRGMVRALRERDALARYLCRDNGLIAGVILVAAAGTIITLLLVKGLYPGGGHDYFTHYFYYYVTVVERGGIWPNEIWYHYYYCKGAGLFFLAMLLTDPLAPQLVSFCFIVTGALALFLFLRRIAPETLWPAVGAVLFLALHIFTPSSTSMFRVHGGWGEFEKLHELVAALVIAVLWASTGALERSGRERLVWWLAAASAIVAAVAIDATIAIVLGGVFALLTAWMLVTRQVLRGILCMSFGAVAGTALLLILIINQITTGLALDQGLGIFWNFADVETLSRWGALADVIYLHRDRAVGEAGGMPVLSLAMVRLLIESARLELLFPLIGGGVVAGALALWRGPRTFAAPMQAAGVIAVVLVFLGLAVTAARAQPISYYRYTTFVVAFTIAAGVLGWGIAAVAQSGWLKRLARNEYTAALVLLACLIVLRKLTGPYTLLSYGSRFAIGQYSIDMAYQTQFMPVMSTPWTAIYPGARGAYEAVGPGTRIWSLHVHMYCMLPDCRIESFHSFLLTRRPDQVLFGSAEEAKKILQDYGLNYFLFSAEDAITDPLPLSALFHPDHIAEHLGIRWTDGTTSLLTWKGPDTVPLDEAWLAHYRDAVANEGTVASYPYAEIKAIFAKLNATPHPWQRFKLPWQRD